MKVVGEEEIGVERCWGEAESGGVAFGNDSLGVEPLDPRKGGGVGEAEIIGEEEGKIFVVGVALEEGGTRFGVVDQVVVTASGKVADE